MKTRWVRKSRLLLILVAGLLVGALVAPAASASEKLVEQIRVAITHATFSLNSDELGPEADPCSPRRQHSRRRHGPQL